MILRPLLASAVIAVAACMLRIREYRRWFRLPFRRTDSLHCRLPAAVVPLHLDRKGFEIPAGVALHGRTVLLQLCVRASVLGWLFDPCISIGRDRLAHRQYFERGTAGQRVLDLSPHFRSAVSDRRVALAGRLMRWQREASLHVFEPVKLADTNVLIVAPHPDDAEIAAFGVYATHHAWIVTITAGERGGGVPPLGIPGEECCQWAARLRVGDSLSVPILGKVSPERCVNLACPDGALERMYRQPAESFRLACEPQLPRSELRSMNPVPGFRDSAPCTWNGLVDDLRRLLEQVKPDVVVCPHPLLDGHSDHVFATHAVERAVRSAGIHAPLFLLYAVHCAGAPVFPHNRATAITGVVPHGEPGWVADSIYSHTLDPQLRLAKLLALESMHGVRSSRLPFPERIRGLLAGLGTDPTSFLRRAPRPTETYYAVAGDRLCELLTRKLG